MYNWEERGLGGEGGVYAVVEDDQINYSVFSMVKQ